MNGRRLSKGAIVGFMASIVLVGLVRLGLTVSGTPDEISKYSSMTVVILAGCLYFGAANLSWKELVKVSYLLILPYMAVELGGIGYTWATGKTTIFHVPEYSFEMPVDLHFWGHLVGGLTWEPLSLFIVMLIVRAVFGASRRWTSSHGRPKSG
jgi:hypothetical protein